MSVIEPEPPAHSLINRVLSLLLHPAETWDVIEAEPATIEGLYKGWVLPLAAVPAVCTAVGMLSFGSGGIFGLHFRLSPVWLIGEAMVSYALTLAMVYVLALIIEPFAPQFGGELRTAPRPSRSAAYAWTACLGGGRLRPAAYAGHLRAARGALQPLPALSGPSEADAGSAGKSRTPYSPYLAVSAGRGPRG